MLIDTHTHLYVEEFDEDREEVIQKALDMGVSQFCLPAIDASYHDKMFQLEQLYPNHIQLMMGLHPCYVKPDSWEKELQSVEEALNTRDFIAIGEIGIDLYWDTSTLEIQQQAFRQQIHWANERHLPIVIHSRNSFDEVFEVLDSEKDESLFGIFHCFTGNLEQAQHAVDLGFVLGIGGVVTFKNGGLDTFLQQIPIEHIVLETDSPYLAPVPFRGKRNVPAYLDYIVDKLSSVYGVEKQEIIDSTTRNAKRVFGL